MVQIKKDCPQSIPYLAFDEALAKFERVNKRSWIITIILIILLFATNGAWLYYESQFSVVKETTTVTQENSEGINNFIGNDGDINNGETDSNQN